MSNELKLCPFCGSKADIAGRDAPDGKFVYCTKCFAQSDKELARRNVVALWNARAPKTRHAVSVSELHSVWEMVYAAAHAKGGSVDQCERCAIEGILKRVGVKYE